MVLLSIMGAYQNELRSNKAGKQLGISDMTDSVKHILRICYSPIVKLLLLITPVVPFS